MDANVIIDGRPIDTDINHTSRQTIKQLPPDKKFHIFFSYRDVPRDKIWVKRVIDKLETEHGYKCCDHDRDFLPGTKIMDNIKDGVKNSVKVVVVFSKEAIDSHYVLLEAEMAHKLSLERRKNFVIPVLLDDCDVPEEFMLLTYIDARDGVEETSWWPKLMKSIETSGETARSPFHMDDKIVAVDPPFAANQLCSTETKYSCLRCTIETDSKYAPAELRAVGVPVDLIRATYKDLLQSPIVICRQKCCCFATIGMVIGFLVLAGGFILLSIPIMNCSAITEEPNTVCMVEVSGIYVLVIGFVICCFVFYKVFYIKNPYSVKKKIIDYNKKLSKFGVMVTVVPACMWRKASIIFYKCKFEICKEYVTRHLMKEECNGTTELSDIPNRGHINNDSPLLSGVGEPRGSREQNLLIVSAIDQLNSEEAENITSVADDEPLLSIEETENLDDEDNILSARRTSIETYMNKALDLLLWCTPEYFVRKYDKNLKNPKKYRHGLDVMCLCQYLEEVHKGFRNTAKKMQSLSRKSNIEENDQDVTDKHLKNISLL